VWFFSDSDTAQVTVGTNFVIPTVTTNTATSITSNSAVLNSNLGSMGEQHLVKFVQYGKTTSYGFYYYSSN